LALQLRLIVGQAAKRFVCFCVNTNANYSKLAIAAVAFATITTVASAFP